MSGLEGRGIVVTGAAGAIGREVARLFAEAHARVCAVDLDQAAVNSVAAALPAPERHLAMACDITDLDGHESLLRRALDAFGRLDALVHLAAVLRRRADPDEVTEEDWDVQLNVNLKATFFLNRTAARLFREQGRPGRIVNFASQAWWTGGLGGSVVYAASKGGVVSMSRGLARTFAPDGITVNTVSPGIVDTPMLRSGLTDEEVEEQAGLVPLGRMARPAEIAGAVIYLASDEAAYITGATINVSGGQLMY